ncbi:MAG: glutamine--fructose-6-phosphate transaminase (isomerizing) [Candidatus Spechtbacterales bacterium]
MCGIIGYVGHKNDPRIGLDALKRLEYRGYDSAGMAYYNSKTKKITANKAVGRISFLENKLNAKKLEGSPFIYHTRWATHGAPIQKNAHPHADCTGNFYLAHNGIIENYLQLRDWLKNKGHSFKSETDTEVLVHLIEHNFKGDLFNAVKVSLARVTGTYGIAVISSKAPGELIAARLGSPLLIGVAKDGHFVASDPAGILAHTKKVVYLEDGEIAKLNADEMHILNKNTFKEPEVEEIEWNLEEAQKGGYPHFMLKEIMEQPSSIRETFRGRLILRDGNVKLGGLELVQEKLKQIKKLHIIACGTAYYAGMVGKYMLEEYAGIPTEVELGSEFRYRKPIFDKKDSAVICISQSGETADTIAPLKEAKNRGVLTLGIVNVVGSTIARETDAGVYNHAGPEIGVASTKALTSQLTALAMLTVFLGRQRQMSHTMGKRIVEEIEKLPKLVESVLAEKEKIKKFARKYKNYPNMLYLGRKYNYPIALEGALKVKEISYMHAEGYAGGEMKHGPIALIEESFPTMAIMPKDSVYEKMVSNIEELKARSGPIIAVTTRGNKSVGHLSKDVIYIPKTLEMLTPIISVIPLQLFAYYVGVFRGLNVDKPRNLAKSVTVE